MFVESFHNGSINIISQVVKLHTRLGKPIPSTDPVVQGKVGAATKVNTSSNSSSGTTIKKHMTITTSTSTTPKINFNPCK